MSIIRKKKNDAYPYRSPQSKRLVQRSVILGCACAALVLVNVLWAVLGHSGTTDTGTSAKTDSSTSQSQPTATDDDSSSSTTSPSSSAVLTNIQFADSDLLGSLAGSAGDTMRTALSSYLAGEGTDVSTTTLNVLRTPDISGATTEAWFEVADTGETIVATCADGTWTVAPLVGDVPAATTDTTTSTDGLEVITSQTGTPATKGTLVMLNDTTALTRVVSADKATALQTEWATFAAANSVGGTGAAYTSADKVTGTADAPVIEISAQYASCGVDGIRTFVATWDTTTTSFSFAEKTA